MPLKSLPSQNFDISINSTRTYIHRLWQHFSPYRTCMAMFERTQYTLFSVVTQKKNRQKEEKKKKNETTK